MTILIEVSIAMIKYNNQKQLGKKRVYIFSLYFRSQTITKGGQAETLAETQRNAYCLAPWLILNFIYRTEPRPKVNAAHSGPGPLTLYKTIPYRNAHSPI